MALVSLSLPPLHLATFEQCSHASAFAVLGTHARHVLQCPQRRTSAGEMHDGALRQRQ